MKYRVRYFYSKGAFMVLLWLSLIGTTYWSMIALLTTVLKDFKQVNPSLTTFVELMKFPLLAFGPLAGWLADSRLGNFKVFKFGAIMILTASVLACVTVLLHTNVKPSFYITYGNTVVAGVFFGLGLTACLGTALQLGLDQMPDASASNITSFVNWFVFSLCFGFWISDCLWYLSQLCTFSNTYVQAFSLIPVICMSIACCTVFLMAPKWLTIEPGSPKVLKTIYQVLKFAAKHKAPLNRSALTYWEEDVPSRLDLGKERYGGPFTTEQIEDVKTFFKILIIHIPLFIVSVTFRPGFMQLGPKALAPNSTDVDCSSALVHSFTYSAPWCAMVAFLVSEFLVYPFLNVHRWGTLKQIGFLYFAVVLINTGFLTSYVCAYVYPGHFYLNTLPDMLSSAYFGCMDLELLILLMLTFICAQSPYKMRGLLSGFSIFLHLSSLQIGQYLFSTIFSTWTQKPTFPAMIHSSLAVGLSLTGFLLHCVLAHWYKRRVRDEGYHQHMHRTIEEIYSRRVSLYGT